MITIIPDPQPSADGTPAAPWDPAGMCDASAGHPGDRSRQLFCRLRAGHLGPHHDEVDHVMWTAQPPGGVAELGARRTAAAAVAADFNAAMASFGNGGQRPDYATWALRLEQHLRYVLEALGGPDGDEDDEDQADEDDDLEPYCYTCGATVGIFIGHGDAWLHYTGQGTAEDPVELFDAGHAPVVAWRPAGAP
jgi:hypothetical protein